MEKQKLLLEMKIKKNKVWGQVKLNIVRKSVKKSYVIKNVNLEKKEQYNLVIRAKGLPPYPETN